MMILPSKNTLTINIIHIINYRISPNKYSPTNNHPNNHILKLSAMKPSKITTENPLKTLVEASHQCLFLIKK